MAEPYDRTVETAARAAEKIRSSNYRESPSTPRERPRPGAPPCSPARRDRCATSAPAVPGWLRSFPAMSGDHQWWASRFKVRSPRADSEHENHRPQLWAISTSRRLVHPPVVVPRNGSRQPRRRSSRSPPAIGLAPTRGPIISALWRLVQQPHACGWPRHRAWPCPSRWKPLPAGSAASRRARLRDRLAPSTPCGRSSACPARELPYRDCVDHRGARLNAHRLGVPQPPRSQQVKTDDAVRGLPLPGRCRGAASSGQPIDRRLPRLFAMPSITRQAPPQARVELLRPPRRPPGHHAPRRK